MSLPEITVTQPSNTSSFAEPSTSGSFPDRIDETRLLQLTYADLLTFLTNPLSSTITYPEIDWLLNDRLDRLQNLHDPFFLSNDQARAQVEKLEVRGLKLSKEEKNFILKFGQTWRVNEIQVALLWKSYASAFSLPPLKLGKEEGHALGEADLMRDFLAFYLEERLNVTRIVSALIRAAESEEDASFVVARQHLGRVMGPYEEYIMKALAAYENRAQRALPAAAHTRQYRTLSPFYARHYIQEQVAFLELIFLANYIQPVSAATAVNIIKVIYQTKLGAEHEHLKTLLMDETGMSLVRSLKVISILLGVGLMRVEALWDPTFSLVQQKGTTLASNPDVLLSLEDLMVQTPGDPNYAPIILAWSVVLHGITEALYAAEEIPLIWSELTAVIAHDAEKGPKIVLEGARPAFEEFAAVAFDPEMNLFEALQEILTVYPFELESYKGSAVLSATSALAYRSVLKGLMLSVPMLIQLPYLSDLTGYLETLCTLIGRGPAQDVSRLAYQFWAEDMEDPHRSTLLVTLAARAPLSFVPLLRLLATLCGNGSGAFEKGHVVDERAYQQSCASAASQWFAKRKQFTCRLRAEDIGILWESGPRGWVTKKPISFPGGGVIERDVVGQVLNQGHGHDDVVVAWPVSWSGHHLLMDILQDYLFRHDPSTRHDKSVTPDERKKARVVHLTLEDVQIYSGEDETELVSSTLTIIAAFVRARPPSVDDFNSAFVAASVDQQPFLELLVQVFELVFLRTNPRSEPRLAFIGPLLDIFSSILANSATSKRLWFYLRSSSLFASGGPLTRLVSREQVLGAYDGTVHIVHLVSALVEDVRCSRFAIAEGDIHAVRAQVLQQALNFVLQAVWVDFLGWRYELPTQRLIIGEKVTEIWVNILGDWSLAPADSSIHVPYRSVVLHLTGAFLGNTMWITPITTLLRAAPEMITALSKVKKTADRALLYTIVERVLSLVRLALLRKDSLSVKGLCALETALFGDVGGDRRGLKSRPSCDMIQLLVDYVLIPYPSSTVQLNSVKTLASLCRSVCSAMPPPSLVGHLLDAVQTSSSVVDILRNDFVPSDLRCAVWNFASTSVATRQALGSVFISGVLPLGPLSENVLGKKQASAKTVLDAAFDVLSRWQKLRDIDPSQLAAALGFLLACWEHYSQYVTVLKEHREDQKLWGSLMSIVSWDLGDDPSLNNFEIYSSLSKAYRSSLHDMICSRSAQFMVKAYAIQILALDTALPISDKTMGKGSMDAAPQSFKQLSSLLRQPSSSRMALLEAITNNYSPALMQMTSTLFQPFERFDIDQLRNLLPSDERDWGDDYLCSLELIAVKLRGYQKGPHATAAALKGACALSLSWSLIDRHVSLTTSWRYLLDGASRWTRLDQTTLRRSIVNVAALLADEVAKETRRGEPMVAIHSERISFLHAAINAAGLLAMHEPAVLPDVYSILASTRNLLAHDLFPPLESFRQHIKPSFHRPILQILHWCSRLLCAAAVVKSRDSVQWSSVSTTMDAALEFITVALREALSAGLVNPGASPNSDLELLITLFDRCSRPELHPAPAVWLRLCENVNLIPISLQVLSRTNIGDVHQDVDVSLCSLLYANHILAFHMILTKAREAADRLVREGVLSVYTSNSLTPVLENGSLLIRDPMTGTRSMAHEAWCMLLSVTAGLVGVINSGPDVFELQLINFIYVYDARLRTVLGWHFSDPLSLAFLEELERVVGFFNAISAVSSSRRENDLRVTDLLSVYSEKALSLLQQLNYALTHPNHTMSHLEPLSPEEREYFEQDEVDDTGSSTDLIDPVKRPALSSLLQRLFVIARDLSSSLMSLSHPDAVIRSSDPADWPSPFNVEGPVRTSMISLDERASIGTLLELGNHARDSLYYIIGLRPTSDPPLPPLCTASFPPFKKEACSLVVREALEILLLYTTAEITRGLADTDVSMADVVEEEDEDISGGGRRKSSKAVVDPSQRALRGELVSELRELLTKSAAVFEKMDGRAGGANITTTKLLEWQFVPDGSTRCGWSRSKGRFVVEEGI